MSLTTKRRQPSRERSIEAPRDKPRVERAEHGNLERPGAQIHPIAPGWQQCQTAGTDWSRYA